MFPVVYSPKKRTSGSLSRKIERLKSILRKLQRAIEKEADKKRQRDEVRKIETAIAKSRQTLSKMRSDKRRLY